MITKDQQNMLVSIVIVTYNSSKFIVDALEGVKRQTYNNIELIVSDDCSKDNTVAICKAWLKENASRFINTHLVTTDVNSGVSANCNRGAKKATGVWVKVMGGDDILAENAVETVVNFATNNPEVAILTGRYQTFTVKNNAFNLDEKQRPFNSKLDFFNLTPKQQLYKFLTETNLGISPGTFGKRDLYDKFGYFNEDFPFLEDLPYFVNLSQHHVKFHLLNATLMYYRKEHGSILKSNTNAFNVKYMASLLKFKTQIAYKIVPKTNVVYYQNELIIWVHYWVLMYLFKNKKTKLSFIIGKLIKACSIKLLMSKLK